ncbi:MAG: hypothetical protein R6V50_08045 [Thermoplasmatota archaeon]
MKKLYLKSCILIIFLILFFSTIGISYSNDGIKISNMDYSVVKTEGSGSAIFTYYTIIVTVENRGSAASEPLRVIIFENDETDDYPGTKTRIPPSSEDGMIVNSGETKDFIFGETNDWMIQGTAEHMLTVSVHPFNNESTVLYSETLTIRGENQIQNETSGFQSLVFIGSLITLFLIFKKAKKDT